MRTTGSMRATGASTDRAVWPRVPRWGMAGLASALLAAALAAAPLMAETTEEHRAKRPDLFHPETGLRIARQRAPTPDDVPGAERVSAAETRALAEGGAVLLDVGGAAQSRYDDLDGTWLVPEPHPSLPNAVWLPETGRGTLSFTMARYLSDTVARLTGADLGHPIVVFCIADCWMSWNAAQHLGMLGYREVYWFAEGVDGWREEGWPLPVVDPVPVDLD